LSFSAGTAARRPGKRQRSYRCFDRYQPTRAAHVVTLDGIWKGETMSTESTSRPWPWFGIDPTAWIRSSWTMFSLAPHNLIQPIVTDSTLTINEVNSSAPDTEAQVVSHHSYGRQLGRMSDALEALIEERGPEARSDKRFHDFMAMKQQIDRIKFDATAARVARLRADLAALKKARPAEYRRLRDALRPVLDD
jgi:hypothetical protein